MSSSRVSLQKQKRKFEGFKLFLMISPFLVLVFIFCWFPLYGWIYAFFDFQPPTKLAQSEFVGVYWFKLLISNSIRIRQTLEVLRNTFVMSGLGILTSWVPILFAILLSQCQRSWLKRSVQTITTLPNFISWVLVYSFAFALFSNNGAANSILMKLNVIDQPILFLQQSNHVWLNMLLWGMWKSLGWSSILYLAALSGIDSQLYDAAKVDGAGRFRIIWHVDLPGLIPTYFVLLLLSVASFLNNGMDQYYVFQNAFNKSQIQVLDLYVYNIGIVSGSYSLATAISMLKSVVSVTLLFSSNKLSKVIRGESII